jgi:ketosteroid isomerase-like protein
MRIPTAAAILLSLAAVATPAVAQSPSTPSAELPSVSLPADLDRVLRDYERTWRSGDASSVAALFATDGFVMQNGRAPARGRTAITSAYTGQAGGALRLRALGYAAADTVGYIIGAYAYGDAPGDMGKFTLTLRRPRGGGWEIFSDMDNGNQPRRMGPPHRRPRYGSAKASLTDRGRPRHGARYLTPLDKWLLFRSQSNSGRHA